MKRGVASVLILIASIEGCARTVPGDPHIAGAIGPIGSELSFTQPQLDRMLLNDAHINTIMNARTMRTYRVYTGIPVQPGEVYSDPHCAVALFNTTVPAYSTSGYVAARGKKVAENLKGMAHDIDEMAHDIDEAVVAFQGPSEARKFVGTARAAWQGCGGRRVTYTGTDRVVQPWTLGMPRTVGEIIAINNETIDEWGCGHAMASKSNAVVDVDACGYNVADEATAIARAMTTVSQ
jgi:PknH-like extracellular domain